MSSGKLGNINLVTSTNGFPTSAYDYWFKKETGGGMLLATGVYNIMFTCMVYDEMPEKIIADAFVNDDGTYRF